MIQRTGGDLLQWLRGFASVAAYGNITHAARHMGLNQSAVSHQIKNLEREFQVALFERRGNALALTAEGRLLQEKTAQLFDVLNETRAALSSTEGGLRGEISMSLPHAMSQNFLPGLISDFHAEHPEATFAVRGGSSAQILEDVLRGRVHFGMVNQYRELDDYAGELTQTPLFGSRLHLIGPPGNPFNLPGECALRDLAEVPFISFFPDYAVGLMVADYVRRHDISLRTVMWANSFNVLLRQVETGLGVAVVDTFATLRDCACEAINLMDELPLRRYILIRRKNRHIPPQTRGFLNFLKDRLPPRNGVSLLLG